MLNSGGISARCPRGSVGRDAALEDRISEEFNGLVRLAAIRRALGSNAGS